MAKRLLGEGGNGKEIEEKEMRGEGRRRETDDGRGRAGCFGSIMLNNDGSWRMFGGCLGDGRWK